MLEKPTMSESPERATDKPSTLFTAPQQGLPGTPVMRSLPGTPVMRIQNS